MSRVERAHRGDEAQRPPSGGQLGSEGVGGVYYFHAPLLCQAGRERFQRVLLHLVALAVRGKGLRLHVLYVP